MSPVLLQAAPGLHVFVMPEACSVETNAGRLWIVTPALTGHHESVRPGGYPSRAREAWLRFAFLIRCGSLAPGEGQHIVRIIQYLCTRGRHLEAGHHVRAGLPLRLRRLDQAPLRPGLGSGAPARARGRNHRRRHGRDDGGLRADEDGPEAGDLRSGPHRRPAALADIRGRRRHHRRTWRHALSRSHPPASTTTSISLASSPGPFPIRCHRQRHRRSSISKARRSTSKQRSSCRRCFARFRTAGPRHWRRVLASRTSDRPCANAMPQG